MRTEGGEEERKQGCKEKETERKGKRGRKGNRMIKLCLERLRYDRRIDR